MAAAASLRALAPRSDNRRAGRSERGRGRCWTGTPPREASPAGRALAEATGMLAQPWHPGPSSEGHLRKASLRKGHRRRHRPRVVCQRGPREDGHDDPPTSENWQRRGGLPTAARPPASGPCGRETPIPALLVSVLPVTGAATMALWVTAGIL